MSDEYVVVEDETPVSDGELAPEPTGNLRRGRPRDQAVIERDERVLGALSASETKTKVTLAQELGLEPGTVYLSLWRLQRAGLVTREQRSWRQSAPAE